ncbi:MAG: hypothetical protein O9972_39780 [Burkholderiales bacterium]|nr:hypothetical protein [Burkholderiales bacterium]
MSDEVIESLREAAHYAMDITRQEFKPVVTIEIDVIGITVRVGRRGREVCRSASWSELRGAKFKTLRHQIDAAVATFERSL